MTSRARVVSISQLRTADFDSWRRLDANAIAAHPFLSADYYQSAPQTWPAAGRIRLLIVEREGQWVFLMPIARAPALRGPWPYATSTADSVFADETGRAYPLVARDDPESALATALASLQSLGLSPLLDITVPAAGELHKALMRAIVPSRTMLRGLSNWPYRNVADSRPAEQRLDVAPPHRSTNSRRKLRQQLNAIQRDSGSTLTAEDVGARAELVDEFLNLQAVGWKGDAERNGLAYRRVGRERWLHELASAFDGDRRFRMFIIRAGGVPVYMNIGLKQGRTLFWLQDAYDETWAGRGLGTLGRAACVNWFAADESIDAVDPNMFWGYIESAKVFPDMEERVRVLLASTWRSALVLLVLKLAVAGSALSRRVLARVEIRRGR